MSKEVDRCIKENDGKTLKYIFVDSLDVDPTFKSYEEDFNKSLKVNGFIEPNMGLTPFEDDSSRWTEEYWTQLKVDLLKNFSLERFNFMRKMALVLKKDKIARLKAEKEEQSKKVVEGKAPQRQVVSKIDVEKSESIKFVSEDEQLRVAKEEAARELKRQNEEIQRKKEESIRKAQQQIDSVSRNDQAKKEMGIGPVIIVPILIVIIVIMVLIISMAN